MNYVYFDNVKSAVSGNFSYIV